MVLESTYTSPFPLPVVKIRPFHWPGLLQSSGVCSSFYLPLFWKYPNFRVIILMIVCLSTHILPVLPPRILHVTLCTAPHPVLVTRAFVVLTVVLLLCLEFPSLRSKFLLIFREVVSCPFLHEPCLTYSCGI